jgi:hypothetical protein
MSADLGRDKMKKTMMAMVAAVAMSAGAAEPVALFNGAYPRWWRS